MASRRKGSWRTVRILIEIPFQNPEHITNKKIIYSFAGSFDHSLPKLDVNQLGKVRIKDADRALRGKVYHANTSRG